MATIVTTDISNLTQLSEWNAACPNLVGTDTIWQGRLTTLLNPTSPITLTANNPDATRYMELTYAPGAGIKDQIDPATEALNYGASNGAGLLFSGLGIYDSICLNLSGGIRITGIQIKRNRAEDNAQLINIGAGAPTRLVENIFGGTRHAFAVQYDAWEVGASQLINNLFIGGGVLSNGGPALLEVYFNTFIGASQNFRKDYGTAALLRDNVYTDYLNVIQSGSQHTSDHNAFSGATGFGTSAVTNLSGGLVGQTLSAPDARAVGGSAITGAGVAISGITTDILGRPRDVSTPTIGAFEYISATDETAPTLSSASGVTTGTTTASLSVSTNEGNGTLYCVVSTSSTAPNVTQIQAGQTHTSAAAPYSANVSVSSTGVKNFSATGLTSGTTYYAHFQHRDAANNNSTVVTSASFTMQTAATAVTLSGPSAGTVSTPSTNFTVGANGAITGTVTVTPNDGGQGGTFNPTSVNISSGTPTATFTYTAATVGAKTISVTNNGSLSNPSNITYTASATNNPPSFSGTIPTQSGTIGVAFTLNTASYFSDSDTLTYSKLGTWPAGVDINSTTGSVTGTPSQSGSFTGLQVRVTDTASQTATSNTFSFTVAAAATGSLVCTTGLELKTNAVAAANLTGLNVRIYNTTTGALAHSITNGTTNSNGAWATITHANIIAGTVYDVVFHETPLATGRMAIRRVTAS